MHYPKKKNVPNYSAPKLFISIGLLFGQVFVFSVKTSAFSGFAFPSWIAGASVPREVIVSGVGSSPHQNRVSAVQSGNKSSVVTLTPPKKDWGDLHQLGTKPLRPHSGDWPGHGSWI